MKLRDAVKAVSHETTQQNAVTIATHNVAVQRGIGSRGRQTCVECDAEYIGILQHSFRIIWYDVTNIYIPSETSMIRTSLGPWKFVRDIDS